MAIRKIAAAIAFAAGAGFLTAALAHHGWTWASEEQTDLSGKITEVYVGPPHPVLRVETADDGVWTVDLANPTQTAAAGFDENSAHVGDQVIVRGHKSLKAEEKHMKAVRVTVEGKRYDLYPDRIVEDGDSH